MRRVMPDSIARAAASLFGCFRSPRPNLQKFIALRQNGAQHTDIGFDQTSILRVAIALGQGSAADRPTNGRSGCARMLTD